MMRNGGRKRPHTGILLAALGGTFGLHRFYLDDRRGWLYLALCWTALPALAGLVEAFDMPRRVRIHNAESFSYVQARHRWLEKMREGSTR